MADAITQIPVYPSNDLILELPSLKEILPGSIAATVIAAGTFSCFLATTDAPDATRADPSLDGDAALLAGGNLRVAFDADDLDPTVMGPLFDATPTNCYIIVILASGFRIAIPCIYTPSRPPKSIK
jgi:hypothetical protein